MKVIHAGIFQDHCLGGDIIFKKGWLANGWGHQEFDYRRIAAEAGRELMNRTLIESCSGGDLLFIGKGELLDRAALATIRRNGCRIALWYGDLRSSPEPWLLNNLGECDAFFMSSAGATLKEYYDSGRPRTAAFYFNPCDPELPAQFSDVPRSVSPPLFTGTRHGFLGPERLRVMKYLRERADVAMIGSPRYLGTNRHLLSLYNRLFPVQYLRGPEYISAIIRSRFGIGASAFQNVRYYTSDRMSHYLTFGKLYIAHHFPGCEDLLADGRHVAYFRTLGELREKIDYYLAHSEEAERLGHAGQEKVLRDFNPQRTVRMMLDIIETGRSDIYPWNEIYP